MVGRFDLIGEKTGVEGDEVLFVGNRILGGEEEGNAGGFEGFTKNAGFVNEDWVSVNPARESFFCSAILDFPEEDGKNGGGGGDFRGKGGLTEGERVSIRGDGVLMGDFGGRYGAGEFEGVSLRKLLFRVAGKLGGKRGEGDGVSLGVAFIDFEGRSDEPTHRGCDFFKRETIRLNCTISAFFSPSHQRSDYQIPNVSDNEWISFSFSVSC